MEFSFDIVVVKVIEHVANLFESFIMTLATTLPHDICNLGNGVFQFRFMINLGCSIIET